jgi:hypothetical protein
MNNRKPENTNQNQEKFIRWLASRYALLVACTVVYPMMGIVLVVAIINRCLTGRYDIKWLRSGA